MKGDNIAAIINSPAFTIFVGTVCIIVVMHQIPVVVATIREMKQRA
jgi:hypothetical protein